MNRTAGNHVVDRPTPRRRTSAAVIVFGSLLALATAAGAGGRHTAEPTQRLSIDDINGRVAALQRSADSLTQVRTRLRQDSARISLDATQRGSAQARRQSEADEQLSKKTSAHAALRAQYEKALQDSLAMAARNREQLSAAHKEIARLEAQIITLSNDLQTYSTRRDQLNEPQTSDDKGLARMQAQIVKRDSAIRARQAEIADLTARRDRQRQDSVQTDEKRASERTLFHAQIARVDNDIAAVDASLNQAESKQAAVRGAQEQKVAQLKENYVAMSRQQRGYTDRISRMEADINALTAEKQRLVQQSGSSQQRYQAARAPYEQAFTNAEAQFQAVTKDKAVLQAVRQKLAFDAEISKTRDALDQAIQGEAEKKKGAKKLVEQKENDLDSLLKVQDAVIRSVAGFRQKEAQLRGATLSQKVALADTAIARSDKQIAAAAAQRDKARNSLAAFEQKNPAPENSSDRRVAMIDSSTAVLKKDVIRMTEINDSLNVVMQEVQSSITKADGAVLGAGSGSDTISLAKKEEKNALVAKRTKLVHDSVQNEAANMGAALRVKNETARIGSQLTLAQNDLALQTTERDRAKTALNAALEKNSQNQSSLSLEKKKTDSLIAAKQQEITLISMKSEKLRQDSISLYRRLEMDLRNLAAQPASLLGQVTAAEREAMAAKAQSDSLKRASLAGQARPAEESKRISAQIAAVSRAIEADNREIASLGDAKAGALGRLKKDHASYDSAYTATEQQLAAVITRRDRARQDSIAAENEIRQAAQKMLGNVREQDSAVVARQRELADLNAVYLRARDDSARTAEKIPAGTQSYSQAIKSVDALIALKEKELADLRARRDKAMQDSLGQRRRQNEQVAAAHQEILKCIAAMDRKRTEVSLAMTEKKRVQGDTLIYRKKFRQALMTADEELQRENALIDKKKADLARIQKERDAAASRLRQAGGAAPAPAHGSTVIVTEPAAEPSASEGSTPAAASPEAAGGLQPLMPSEIAQKRSEEIYTLLGENRVAEASKRFRQQMPFLRSNLDAEAFQTLRNTIEQMGGTVIK